MGTPKARECSRCKERAQDIYEANMEFMLLAGDFNALYDELREECEHDLA